MGANLDPHSYVRVPLPGDWSQASSTHARKVYSVFSTVFCLSCCLLLV